MKTTGVWFPWVSVAILTGSSPALVLSAQMVPAPSTASESQKQPWPGIETFTQKQIHTASSEPLLACLPNLYRDSSRCRALLEALWKEQPRIRMTLLPVAGLGPPLRPRKLDPPCFGLLFVQPTSTGYDVVVAVQTELTQGGQDMAEPWLAQMLFSLLELTRRDSVVGLGKRLALNTALQRQMWEFQRGVRAELKASRPEFYARMAFDGEYLFKVKLQ